MQKKGLQPQTLHPTSPREGPRNFPYALAVKPQNGSKACFEESLAGLVVDAGCQQESRDLGFGFSGWFGFVGAGFGAGASKKLERGSRIISEGSFFKQLMRAA